MVVLIALTSVLVLVAQQNKHMLHSIKAQLVGCAFFLSIIFAQSAFAECEISVADKPHWQRLPKSAIALDGDSIKFSGGQIRLLGVNTPERGEPLSDVAKKQLQDWVDEGVYWFNPNQAKDHYGRYLGHLFFADGRSVNARLLSQGLAFLALVPPELSYSDCYINMWSKLLGRPKGVLNNSYYQPVMASDTKKLRGGYLRVKGVVNDVKRSRNAWWIRLDGDVVITVRKKHWAAFVDFNPSSLVGRKILVSGWVNDRRGSKADKKGYAGFVLTLTHPEHLQQL